MPISRLPAGPGRPDRHPDRRDARLRRAARRPARRRSLALGDELSDLQERLFAEGVDRLGTPRRAAGAPGHGHLGQGRHAAAHGRPGRPAGRAHHLVQGADRGGAAPTTSCGGSARRCPTPGMIGVFDRSHYEDVLIGRVRAAGATEEIERRYDAINDLRGRAGRRRHHGRQVHAAHLGRGPRRSGCWPGSTTRPSTGSSTPATSTSAAHWPAYREAYEIALERTNTEVAPWYVIPSDRKWYRNLAIGQAPARDADATMNPQWPAADFDVEEQKRRLADEIPVREGRVIPTVAVTRYVTPLREGGSLPGIVEADDLGTYVCKFRGAGQGVRVLVAEVIVAGLAERIGLRTPRLVALELDPRDRPLRGRRGGPGPAQRERRASTWASTSCPARSATTGTSPPSGSDETRPGSCGSTPSWPTSTAPGATPTCCSGTATCG